MPARLFAVGLFTLVYLLGTHWLMTSAPPSPWTAVGLLTPMLGAAALGAFRAGQRVRAALALVVIVALCGQALAGRQMPATLLYLAQHVIVNLALGVWFGGSLRPPGEALITSMAALVHDGLPAAMVLYTRRLTLAWAIFFFGTAAASVVVYLTLPFDRWAEFSNLVCPALVGAMFAGERVLRYRLHPEFERTSFGDQIRAYTRHSAASAGRRKRAA